MVGVVTNTHTHTHKIEKLKFVDFIFWTNIVTTITVNCVNVVLTTIVKYVVSPNLICEMKGRQCLSFSVSYKYYFFKEIIVL